MAPSKILQVYGSAVCEDTVGLERFRTAKGCVREGMGIDSSLDEVGTGAGPIPECLVAHT